MIKKLYIEGFKSFAKPTEVIFNNGLNVIVGPNGSGKSNIIDAICFVLGRLAMKSLRTDRASGLIFKGKNMSNRAIVKLWFDNANGDFTIENEKPKEILIERILRRDGVSIYKINGKTKTRNEILELLNQKSLSPYGFNIILQSEIFKFVEMKPEERRKLIEDLAGISIYETRKDKAMRELEKTEEKLKEVKTIFNEKNNFLKNLEKERKQALIYNKLKKLEKDLRFSILNKKKNEKIKEKEKIIKDIEKEKKEIEKRDEQIMKLLELIDKNKKEIENIDKHIQNISGIELDKLNKEIIELRTNFSKLEFKKNSLMNAIKNNEEKIKSISEEIEELNREIENIREREKEKIGKDNAEMLKELDAKINKLKEKLNYLEKRKEYLNNNKLQLSLLNEKLNLFNKNLLETSSILANKKEKIEKLKQELALYKYDKEFDKKLKEIYDNINKKQKLLIEQETLLNQLNKQKEIFNEEINEISKLSICPKCKREMDAKHKENLINQIKEKILEIDKNILSINNEIIEVNNEIKKLIEEEKILKEEENKMFKAKLIEEEIKREKKNIDDILKNKKFIEEKIQELSDNIKKIESEIGALDYIESEIDKTKFELNNLILEKEKIKNKISSYKQLSLDLEIKEREIEKLRNVLSISIKEKEKANIELETIINEILSLEKVINEKNQKYDNIKKEFSDLLEKKDKLNKEIFKNEALISKLNSEKIVFQNKINSLSIDIAKIDAEISIFDEELKEIGGELINLSIQKLEKKLEKVKDMIVKIGNVNLIAIDAYENTKKEVEEILEKIKKIEKEKEEIINQIKKIDKEKRKIFFETFDKINNIFSENFSKLSEKGTAKLIIDSDNPFESGVDIILKFGKGKYLDSNSLSGGEKVLVALSFIFAIQQVSPYPFYIFDEIDAALDKRNSEKFANLLKKHIGNSQCIIVTHNDATIEKADLIYGVSMQDGISKVISLKP